MIIDEEEDAAEQPDATVDVAGTAYRESITSVDGFTRGANGRVKFNKDTKKRRRDNEDVDGDVEMGDGEGGAGRSKKAKRRAEPKFGHEFKAKVCGHSMRADLHSHPLFRKLVGTSRRAAWIHMPICLCLRRPKRAVIEKKKWESLGNDDLYIPCQYLHVYGASLIYCARFFGFVSRLCTNICPSDHHREPT